MIDAPHFGPISLLMKIIFKLCLIAGLGLAALTARATIMTPLSVENLTQRAELILQGTVASKTCLLTEGGSVYTRIEFNVSAVWKGTLTTNRFIIVHGGGTVGDTTTVVSGQAEYEIGEEVVAFLRCNARGEGASIGLAQGKFQVWEENATGAKFAHNLFHGEPPPAESPALAALRTAAGPPKRLGLQELRQRVEGRAK
jgi:hypothetical protein